MAKVYGVSTILAVITFAANFTVVDFANAENESKDSQSQQQLYLTIYNNNLALVEDKRHLNLVQGRSKLDFKDVSPSIRPETVSLKAQGVNIIEQNFDFDLLTPDKLMEKSVGQQVQLIRTIPGNGQQSTESAKVLSVNQGVVLDVGGRIEVLRADSIPTRVIFNKIPENLRAHPTLSITIDTDKAGEHDTTLSYLSTGLSWKADYVAKFDDNVGKLDLQGWITLTNNSGAGFNNVNAQLVAGDINLTNSMTDYDGREKKKIQMRRTTGNEIFSKPALADYYLYPLAEKTTIADKQTKQISFLQAAGVAAKKKYQYQSYGYKSLNKPEHADVVVQFESSAKSGLGTHLPAGIVRVYMADQNGTPKFVGESAIDHTPQGVDVSVKTGEAFDVTVQPVVVKEESLSSSRSCYSMEYIIHNAKADDIFIDIEHISYRAIRKITSENIKSKKIDAYSLEWNVPVKGNSETKLTFVVEDES